jgi:hypothetical protein
MDAAVEDPSWLRRLARGLYQGPVPILAAFVLSFVLVEQCWGSLKRDTVYHDLVVGTTTILDMDKGRDTRAFVLFLGSLAGFGAGISALFRWVSGSGPDGDVSKGLSSLLLFALVPAIWWFGCAVATPDVFVMPRAAAAPVLVALAAAAGLVRYRKTLTSEHVVGAGGTVLLLAVLGAFAGLGVATLLGRAYPARLFRLAPLTNRFVFLPPAAALALAAAAFASTPRVEDLRRRLCRLLFLVQAPLPLLWCVLIPPPLMEGGIARRQPTSPALPVLIGVLVLAGWVALALRYRKWRLDPSGASLSPASVLSTFALVAVPVFALAPNAVLPSFPIDPFHSGEQLLPWQQCVDQHKLPYAEFIPIHGLMPLLRGLFNAAFFDGTAASYEAADGLLLALYAVALFLTARPLVGPVAALVAGLCVPPVICGDRYLFLAPALFLLARPGLLRSRVKWLAAWGILAPLMVLYNGAIGPAFVLGTAPAAAWVAWRLFREDRRSFLWLAAVAAAVPALLYCWRPVRLVARGFAVFLLENASGNQIANGVALESGFRTPPFQPGFAGTHFLWELVRFSCLGVVVAAGLLFVRELARPRDGRNRRLLWLSGLTLPTLLLVFPWAMGRIDPGFGSRLGAASFVGFLVLPVLLLTGRRLTAYPARVALLALAVSMMSATTGTSDGRRKLPAKPFAFVVVPPGTQLEDGAALGMPKLGRLVLPAARRADLLELKRDLEGWLRPGETFLDLTGASGYYYYLNLPVPALYSAPYVAADSRMQARMLRRLEADPPPVVLVAPSYPFPEGPASLRNYHLYRWCVFRYTPVRRGPFVFLVDPSRLKDEAPAGGQARLDLLDATFRRPHLEGLPDAWGRSWPTLAPRFAAVAALRPQPESRLGTFDEEFYLKANPDVARGLPVGHVTNGFEHFTCYGRAEHRPARWVATSPAPGTPAPGLDSPWTCELAGLGLKGRDADYVKLELDLVRAPGRASPTIEVAWGQLGLPPADWVRMYATHPTLLVPLGANPTWLLGEDVGVLSVRLVDPQTCERFAVREVQFLRLKSVP